MTEKTIVGTLENAIDEIIFNFLGDCTRGMNWDYKTVFKITDTLICRELMKRPEWATASEGVLFDEIQDYLMSIHSADRLVYAEIGEVKIDGVEITLDENNYVEHMLKLREPCFYVQDESEDEKLDSVKELILSLTPEQAKELSETLAKAMRDSAFTIGKEDDKCS